jgi:tetratricopeptide (TPR) repeat protein
MLELYLFIFALVAILALVLRRSFIVSRHDKAEFKKQVAEKVEENRKTEQEEGDGHFREEYIKARKVKGDHGRFKEELRQADMAIAKNNLRDAKRYLIQAMALTENELPVSLKLADVYMKAGDFKRAETLYRKLLEEDPDNPDIYENIGKIMLKKKAYKEAVQAYCRAVELDDKDDRKFLALGKLYHLMMRYGVAAECFKKAAELKPREVNYLFLLADACASDDDYENALFTYEKILTIEPYNEKAKTATQDIRLKIKEQETVFNQ